MTAIAIRTWSTKTERPILSRAIDDLLACAVAAEQASVNHEPAGSILELLAGHPGDLCVISLSAFVDAESMIWSEAESTLRAVFSQLADRGNIVFVVTVFRRVADRASDGGYAQLVRIRRLNLLATELSREFGAFVIDLDREFANVGGMVAGCDFRLQSDPAAQLASETLALALAVNGLDGHLPFAAQERVKGAIEASRKAPLLAAPLFPDDLVTMGTGTGRRRQRVSVITDVIQENHVGWLAGQVLQGRIGLREALHRLGMAIRRRGLRESGRLLASAFSQILHRRGKPG